MTETTHRCPLDAATLTPCCGRLPFELPLTDRLTTDERRVTCRTDVHVSHASTMNTGSNLAPAVSGETPPTPRTPRAR